jgi:transposase-like protein
MRPNSDLKGKVREDELLQKLLPLFSRDVTLINSYIGFANRDGIVYYFNGQMPLFRHEQNDLDSFKMFMAQLYVNGNAKQSEINRTFNLNPINMKRWSQKYMEGGARAFYTNGSAGSRKPHVLTEPVMEKVQSLFDEGYSPSEAGAQLGLKADTLRKAIKSGKLHRRERAELKKTMILV